MSKHSQKDFVLDTAGLNCRVSKHDRFHVEFKLRYKLNKEQKKQKYKVESYFFIPNHFKVSKTNYSSQDFYEDLRSYIRMEALPMKLSALLKDNSSNNPLQRIRQFSTTGKMNLDSDEIHTISYEAKLFAATFAHATHTELQLLNSKANTSELSSNDWVIKAENLFDEMFELSKEFRKIKLELLQPDMNNLVKVALHGVDGYISDDTEKILGKILFAAKEKGLIENNLWEKSSKWLQEERIYRKEIDLGNFAADNTDTREAEKIWHKVAMRKKFVASCLFLDLRKSKLINRFSEMIAGVAAAFAMTFAVLVTIWATEKWPMQSAPWISIAVVAYVFKDRIKEWIRKSGNKILQPFFTDKRITLWEPKSEKKFGTVSEFFSYISQKKLPEDILRERNPNLFQQFEFNHQSESIIKYSRVLNIKNVSISKTHGQNRNIISILRFDFRKFLHSMDDPTRTVDYIDAEELSIHNVKVPRVYHLPVILAFTEYSSKKATTSYLPLKFILDRRGVKRVEALD